MRLLPFQQLTMATNLSMDDVRRRVEALAARSRSSLLFPSGASGSVGYDSFSLRQPVLRSPSFTIQIDGQLRPSQPGTLVSLTMRLGTYTRVFFGIWLVAAALIFVGFSIAALRGTTFAREVGYFPLVLLPFGYVMCWAGFLLGTAQFKSALGTIIQS